MRLPLDGPLSAPRAAPPGLSPATVPGLRHVARLAVGATALAACGRLVYAGGADGLIRLWRADVLAPAGPPLDAHDGPVLALAGWAGRLASGGMDGRAVIWDPARRARRGVLEGHAGPVGALAPCASRLLSGGDDATIRVWAPVPGGGDGGGGGGWVYERVLAGHTGQVCALLWWRGVVLSGSVDRTVRAWDVGSGREEAVMAGHGASVRALAAHGAHLVSASRDGTLRAWAPAAAWACAGTVRPPARADAGQYVRCLCVAGGALVGGTVDGGDGPRVWGLPGLEPRAVLPQPAGAEVWAVLPVGPAVWAAVGEELVVWGHGRAPAGRRGDVDGRSVGAGPG